MDEFRAMYKPIIDNIPLVNYISDTMLAQDTDNPAQRALMVSELPVKFLERVQNRYLEDSGAGKLDKSALASYPDLAKLVQKSLADTVRVPAITQALKGLVSAGTFRSLLYVKEKLGKRK